MSCSEALFHFLDNHFVAICVTLIFLTGIISANIALWRADV